MQHHKAIILRLKDKVKKKKSKATWGKFKLLFQNSLDVRDRGNPKPVLCENLEEGDEEEGGREGSRGKDIRISVVGACWCIAKTITMLLSNYPLIKKKNLT